MWEGIPRRDRRLLLAAIALGVVVRLAYAAITHDNPLRGDELEYHSEGSFFADGHAWWTTAPFGIPHAGVWKAPLYPLWVGIFYTLFGKNPASAIFPQVALGVAVIVLSWVLARRLFGPRAAIVAAFVVALYPMAFQYEELLYSESLAAPLVLVLAILAWTRVPTVGRAALSGVALAAAMYTRPSLVSLAAPVLVVWIAAVGWRRGIGLTALMGAVALVCILPWTARNHHVDGGFTLISIQSAALYGTFNDEAANDTHFPWAWRPIPAGYGDVLRERAPDHVWAARLRDRARDYIRAHPASLVKAFYWNGVNRTLDVRTPPSAQYEVPFEGRVGWFAKLGAWCYLVVGLAALAALWIHRRRRGLVLAVLALLLATAVVYTGDGGTRYRAPLEPLIAILAVAAFVPTRVRPASAPV